MDLPELSEFRVLAKLHTRDVKEFVKINNIYSEKTVTNLLIMNFLIEKTNECWTSDIVNLFTDKKNLTKVIDIAAHFMMKARLINIVDNNPVLGKKYEITNKGMYVLYQYVSWIREKEKDYYYRIRQLRKKGKGLE